MIAAGVGVEMLINHINPSLSTASIQQVRGSVRSMHMDKLDGPASKYCIACSDPIISAVRGDYHSFLRNALHHPRQYLEQLVGLDALKAEMEDLSLEPIDID